jgi:diacylglycerol kinase
MHPFLKGFIYAMRGLVDGIRTQRNMRFHLAVTSLVIAAGIFFGVSHVEWLVLGLCIA